MNTEEIRDEIVTKLAIEREVREQLAKQQAEQNAPPRKSRWAWLESKLGLLVIGAIFSGVLVPVFQYTQERVKWHQQNRYNARSCCRLRTCARASNNSSLCRR